MSEKVYFNSVLVSMISIYKSSEVKPHIIQLFKNEGLDITEDNIKIWSQDTMLSNQVKLACDHKLAPEVMKPHLQATLDRLQAALNDKLN